MPFSTLTCNIKKVCNSTNCWRNSGNSNKQVSVLCPSVFKPKCIGSTKQCQSHDSKASQTTFNLGRTLCFYLVSRQRIQTRILLNIPRSDIKTSTMKRTPHSLTDQCSWVEAHYKSTLINITTKHHSSNNRWFTFHQRCIIMRTLASNGTVLTLATDKQHLLFSHHYFLHPEHRMMWWQKYSQI